MGEAIDRELAWVRERGGAPREVELGCWKISHDRLGFCSSCVQTLRDGGPSGTGLEALGWRLLALREVDNTKTPADDGEYL